MSIDRWINRSIDRQIDTSMDQWIDRQDRIEQNRTEQNKIEQNRTEQNRPDQNRLDQIDRYREGERQRCRDRHQTLDSRQQITGSRHYQTLDIRYQILYRYLKQTYLLSKYKCHTTIIYIYTYTCMITYTISLCVHIYIMCTWHIH